MLTGNIFFCGIWGENEEKKKLPKKKIIFRKKGTKKKPQLNKRRNY